VPRGVPIDYSAAINAGKQAIDAAKSNMPRPGDIQPGGTGRGGGAAVEANAGGGGGGPGALGAAANATIASIIGAGPPTGGYSSRRDEEDKVYNDALARNIIVHIWATGSSEGGASDKKSGGDKSGGDKSGGSKSGNAGATTSTTKTANVSPSPTSSTTPTSPAPSPSPTPSPSAGNPVDPNAGAKQAAQNEYNAAQQENQKLQDDLKRANEQLTRIDTGNATERDKKEAHEKFPDKTPEEALKELYYANGDKITNEINPKIGKNGERIKTAEQNVKSLEPGRNFNH
jgi:hypothetical protein